MKKGWVRVTRQEPCPICGKADWCGRTTDGAVVRCMRMQNDHPCPSGRGWIHRLDDGRKLPERPAPREKEKVDVVKLAKRFYETPKATEIREQVAGELGVSVRSLEMLGVGFGCDYNGKEFSSWPSRLANGRWVGLSRRYLDGSGKKTYPGTSNTGLYYERKWWSRPGPVLILEGGSDVAAAISGGVAAIGRPSNYGSVGEIRSMLLANDAARRVIVVGEHDEKPEKREMEPPDGCKGTACEGICQMCWPGKYGAKRTAQELDVPWIMPHGRFKDFRSMFEDDAIWFELLRSISYDYTKRHCDE